MDLPIARPSRRERSRWYRGNNSAGVWGGNMWWESLAEKFEDDFPEKESCMHILLEILVSVRETSLTCLVLPRDPQVSKKGGNSNCLALWKRLFLLRDKICSNSIIIMGWSFWHQSGMTVSPCTKVMVFSRSLANSQTVPCDTLVHGPLKLID